MNEKPIPKPPVKQNTQTWLTRPGGSAPQPSASGLVTQGTQVFYPPNLDSASHPPDVSQQPDAVQPASTPPFTGWDSATEVDVTDFPGDDFTTLAQEEDPILGKDTFSGTVEDAEKPSVTPAPDDPLETLDIREEEQLLTRDKRTRNFRLLFAVMFPLCAVVLAVSIYQLVSIQLGYKQADDEYDALIPDFSYVSQPTSGAPAVGGGLLEGDSSVFEEKPLTFDEVRAMNSECVAWIEIPETRLNYPVVRAGDNEKYLNRTFLGHSSSAGAIFMDYQNDPAFQSKHTIIYGHNLKNGSMFGSLTNYQDSTYLQQHPTIVIRTGTEELRYQVFKVFVCDMYDPVYQLSFENDETFAAFAGGYGAPAGTRSIITLSTCTNGADEERFIVMAALV